MPVTTPPHARPTTPRLSAAPTAEPPPHIHTLANGVRVLTLVLPQLQTACVSVFVRSGSRNESARQNGISHVVEHMAFKGTATRDCQRINLDAELLGAEVNAHTDKDHTAFHMRGLARDAAGFIAMLGDIVLHGSFPEAELERERAVILQELLEDEDDALSAAFRLYDQICFGKHPLAQPVIGLRRNIERFTRDELIDYVRRQYSGANTIVAIAGPVDPQAMVKAAEQAFSAMPAGTPHQLPAPQHLGGLVTRRHSGSQQTHVVLGLACATQLQDSAPAVLAATLFGEGMSSPLLDQVRERQALVYHASCSADLSDLAGQFVIEASTTPEHLAEYVETVIRLLRQQAEAIDPVQLQRARQQLQVRSLRLFERPMRRLETAALDLYTWGRVRTREEWQARLDAVDADAVQREFARLLASPAALAITGRVPAGTREKAARWLEQLRAN
jgi:predicted Zn-dependent peptidase